MGGSSEAMQQHAAMPMLFVHIIAGENVFFFFLCRVFWFSG